MDDSAAEGVPLLPERAFCRMLASMPNVGEDADFERVRSEEPAPSVFQ